MGFVWRGLPQRHKIAMEAIRGRSDGARKLAAVSRKPGVEVAAAVPLAQGKLNAIRAGF
jgi:hypothetical protein